MKKALYINTSVFTNYEIRQHGSILDQCGGYWIRIEAWGVEASPAIPHGIRYSLTLHEPYGKRILGYDNAHAVKTPGKFK